MDKTQSKKDNQSLIIGTDKKYSVTIVFEGFGLLKGSKVCEIEIRLSKLIPYKIGTKKKNIHEISSDEAFYIQKNHKSCSSDHCSCERNSKVLDDFTYDEIATLKSDLEKYYSGAFLRIKEARESEYVEFYGDLFELYDYKYLHEDGFYDLNCELFFESTFDLVGFYSSISEYKSDIHAEEINIKKDELEIKSFRSDLTESGKQDYIKIDLEKLDQKDKKTLWINQKYIDEIKDEKGDSQSDTKNKSSSS